MEKVKKARVDWLDIMLQPRKHGSHLTCGFLSSLWVETLPPNGLECVALGGMVVLSIAASQEKVLGLSPA